MESKMINDGNDLIQLEDKSSKKLGESLESHLPMLRRAYRLIQSCLKKSCGQRDLPPARKACINLLTRACNELRCINLLVEKGYSLQAFASAGSLFEISWAIAWIAGDDRYGQRWHWHDVEKQSFEKVRDTVEGGLKALGLPSDQTNIETRYRLYRVLCIGKHVNPLIQASDPVIEDSELLLFEPGPRDDIFELLKAWFVLLAAIEAVLPCIESFLKNHLLPVHTIDEVNELADLKKTFSEQKNGSTTALNEVSAQVRVEIKQKFLDFRQLVGL